ncbi:MAG: hypothetical protein P9M14_12880 [Candidatus Alcyoniella australis]|nr:hypothetical protein [Candidatus Alcyoniella australis]
MSDKQARTRLPEGKPGVAAAVLLLMALGNTLFSIAVYKVCTFASLISVFAIVFFLVVMPLGGAVWARRSKTELRHLWLCQWLNIGGVLLGLMAMLCVLKVNFINTWGFSLSAILLHSLFVVVLFSPFFFSWGLSEYAHFQYCAQTFRRPALFYPVFLLGVLAGYLLETYLTWRLGLLFCAAAAIGIFVLNTVLIDRNFRRGALLAPLALALLIGGPLLENRFVQAVRGDNFLSMKAHLRGEGLYFDYFQGHLADIPEHLRSGEEVAQRSSVLYQGWDRYCHFTLFSNTWFTGGTYNDWVEWIFPTSECLDPEINVATLPFKLAGEGKRIVVIGAGGGRQVLEALRHDPQHVWAVEIVPSVFRVLTQVVPEANGGLYLDPHVTTVTADGRAFFREFDQTADLVYLPFTEAGQYMLRTYFEPSQRLYSIESLRAIRDKLSPEGLVVIRKGGLERNNANFKAFFMTLKQAGYNVVGFTSEDNLLVIGSPGPIPQIGPELLAGMELDGFTLIDGSTDFPEARLITDDYPFRGGVIFPAIPPQAFLRSSLYGLAAVCALIVLIMLLSRTPSSLGAGRTPYMVTICLLVGINFMLLENLVIFNCLSLLKTPLDAFYVGSIVFLAVAMVGSLIGAGKRWPYLAGLGAVGALVLALLRPGAWGYLLIGAPMFAAVGVFFPRLFTSFNFSRVRIYVLDAFGAALGSIVVFIVPLLYGFELFYEICLAVFALTALIFALGLRRKWI